MASAYEHLYRASNAYTAAEGALAAKEAAARRLLADAALDPCLPRLRRFDNLPFVVLSPEEPSLSSAEGSSTRAPELVDSRLSKCHRSVVPAQAESGRGTRRP